MVHLAAFLVWLGIPRGISLQQAGRAVNLWYGRRECADRDLVNKHMETAAWMDWIAGGTAAVILLGGLVMLFGGVGAMNQRK